MKSNKSELRRRSSGFVLLLLISIPTALAAQQSDIGHGEDFDGLWNVERSHIERIARLTTVQGGTILFALDRLLGYASSGTAHRLNLPPSDSHCPYRSAALSHDGRFVAFLNSDPSGQCSLSIYDIVTSKIRPLLDLPYAPAALLWSWDDADIVFGDQRLKAPSIRSVSVNGGLVSTIVSTSQLATEKTPAGILSRFDGGAPIQWSHAGNELVVGFRREVPTKNAHWYSSYPVEYIIDLENGGVRSAFEDGYGAQVSPVADRIAWYSDNNKIATANFDGTDRRVLTAPRWMLVFPAQVKGPLVWSPDGEQLIFGTLESETWRDAVYILQLKTKHFRQLMNHTCITITDWR